MTGSTGSVASVCYRHTDRETFVSCTRCERLICPDCMLPASVGFQCPECVKAGNVGVRQPKAAYGGKATSTPTVTFVLIGLNVAMFLLTTATGTGLLAGGTPSSLFRQLAMVPITEIRGLHLPGFDGQGVANGGYYRLLTACFLHYGIIHVALNMLALFQLGPALEAAFGRLRFTALYLVSGIGGSALSYALGPQFSQAAGASGAVFGLFAAFFVLQRRRGGDVSQIGAIIAINLFISFSARSYIDWRGHVGGLITGALVTAALVYAPSGPRRTLLQVGGFVSVALLIVGVVAVRTADLSSVIAALSG